MGVSFSSFGFRVVFEFRLSLVHFTDIPPVAVMYGVLTMAFTPPIDRVNMVIWRIM